MGWGRVHRCVSRDGQWQDMPSKVAAVALLRGDRIRLETAGGGGYGAPGERDADDIERDRREGYVR